MCSFFSYIDICTSTQRELSHQGHDIISSERKNLSAEAIYITSQGFLFLFQNSAERTRKVFKVRLCKDEPENSICNILAKSMQSDSRWQENSCPAKKETALSHCWLKYSFNNIFYHLMCYPSTRFIVSFSQQWENAVSFLQDMNFPSPSFPFFSIYFIRLTAIFFWN